MGGAALVVEPGVVEAGAHWNARQVSGTTNARVKPNIHCITSKAALDLGDVDLDVRQACFRVLEALPDLAELAVVRGDGFGRVADLGLVGAGADQGIVDLAVQRADEICPRSAPARYISPREIPTTVKTLAVSGPVLSAITPTAGLGGARR